MYRTDRIGPWPLVELLAEHQVLTAAAIAAASGVHTSVYCIAVDTAIPEKHRAYTVFSAAGDVAIPAAEGVAIVIQISGAQKALSEFFQLSYAGRCDYECSGVGVSCSPFLGRANAVAATFLATRVAMVPSMMDVPSNLAVQPGSCSCNGSAIYGDLEGGETDPFTALVFGYWFVNRSAGELNISDIRMSMSLERYESDIITFDPNR